MARRVNKLDISMFPFLSVLCSMIGVLMLFMLIIFGTRVTDAKTRAMPADAEDGDSMSGKHKLSQEDHKRLARMLQELETTLVQRHQELQQVRTQHDKIVQLLGTYRDHVELGGGNGLKYGFDISPLQNVMMIPARGSPVTKRPRFIELDAEGYLLHPEQQRYAMSELPALDKAIDENYPVSSPFQLFLQNEAFAKRESQFLLFLIRPSGAPAFDRVRAYLNLKYPIRQSQSQIDVGWEPFAKEWLLLDRQTPTGSKR